MTRCEVHSELSLLGVSSEVHALVDDLVLDFYDSLQRPKRYKPLFCEVARFWVEEKKRLKSIQCRELYRRNKPWSKHVYASYSISENISNGQDDYQNCSLW